MSASRLIARAAVVLVCLAQAAGAEVVLSTRNDPHVEVETRIGRVAGGGAGRFAPSGRPGPERFPMPPPPHGTPSGWTVSPRFWVPNAPKSGRRAGRA